MGTAEGGRQSRGRGGVPVRGVQPAGSLQLRPLLCLPQAAACGAPAGGGRERELPVPQRSRASPGARQGTVLAFRACSARQRFGFDPGLLLPVPGGEAPSRHVSVQPPQPPGLAVRRGGPQLRGQWRAGVRRLSLRPPALAGEFGFPQRGRRGDPGVAVEAPAAAPPGAGEPAAAAPGQAGEPGQERAAGAALPRLWAGGGVQVRHQDCHLPPEPLPRGHHDAGKACAGSPGGLLLSCTCGTVFFPHPWPVCGPKVLSKSTNVTNGVIVLNLAV